MARTQGELLELVRDEADDPDPYPNGRYSDEEIRRWLNRAAREIARMSECLRDKDSIDIIAETAVYVIPESYNLLRIYRVEYERDDRVKPLDYNPPYNADMLWGNRPTQAGPTPSIWTSWDTPPHLAVQIFPVPPTAAGKLNIWFYRYPDDLATDGTDADEPLDLPAGWEDVTVPYVMAQIAKKDGDHRRYGIASEEFQRQLASLVASTAHFTDQSPGQMLPNSTLPHSWPYW